MSKKNKEKVSEENLEDVNDLEQKDLEDELTNEDDMYNELLTKYNKNYEALQRLMAEFDNYKKRNSKEREQLYNSLVSDIISDFLIVMDNLDMALKNESKDEEFKNGVELIKKQFENVLSKYNVEEIKALNETFNPNLHESINHVDDPNYGEKEIIEVFRKGYKLGDKVIRYAMVKVAN